MTNSAYDALTQLCKAWNERRHAHALLAPTFARIDRRPVVGMPDADRDGMAEVEQSMWDLDAQWPLEGEVLAEHGDQLSLTSAPVSFGDGGMRLDFLVLVSIDSDGLVDRLTLFEPEQRVEAEAEFARLAEGLG